MLQSNFTTRLAVGLHHREEPDHALVLIGQGERDVYAHL